MSRRWRTRKTNRVPPAYLNVNSLGPKFCSQPIGSLNFIVFFGLKLHRKLALRANHMGTQVPTWRQSRNFQASRNHYSRFVCIKVQSLLFYAKTYHDLCWEMHMTFSSTHPSTQVLSLTSQKRCHVSIHVILGTWGLETMCEAVFGEDFGHNRSIS